MKKIHTALSFFSILFLFSCEKEAGFSSSGSRLVKMVQKQGADSVVFEYSYDVPGRLSQFKISSKINSNIFFDTLRIIRNTSGVTIRTIQSDSEFQPGIDSIVKYYHYNTFTNRYTSSVSAIFPLGISSSDSIVYTYDASGKIIKNELYQLLLGPSFELTGKNEYSYSAAGNMDLIKIFSYDPGTSSFDQIASVAYTFDNKVNPLKLGIEGVLYFWPSPYNAGPNNEIKSVFTDLSDPTINQTISLTYTYNSTNMPATAINIDSRRGTSNITYYYQ